MLNLTTTKTYPAILTPEEVNGWTVYLPDFDGWTQGENESDAINMAKDWLITSINLDGPTTWPKPTALDAVKSKPEQQVVAITLTINDLIAPHWTSQAQADDDLIIKPTPQTNADPTVFVTTDEWNDDQLTITDDGDIYELFAIKHPTQITAWETASLQACQKFGIHQLAGSNELLLDTFTDHVVDDVINYINAINWLNQKVGLNHA